MAKRDSPIGEDFADEQATMAVLGVALAADEGDAVAAGALDEAVNGRPERVLFRHRPVQGVPFGVVVLLAGGASPELSAEEQIADAEPGEPSLELLTIELRRVARVRI